MTLLIPSIIGLLVGAALLTRGLRGRRVGDEPHCRCGYLLRGLESRVCPECGETLTPARIRYGTRHRIRWQIITASFCVAVALTGLSLHLTGVAQRIDWYRFAPMSWLASAAESGNRNAMADIDRRLSAPRVNTGDFRAAVDAGLRVQKNRPPAADLQAWLNLLSKLEAIGALTAAERNEFFSRIVELSLVARSEISQGDPLSYSIVWVVRAPNTGPLTYRIDSKIARFGDRVASQGGTSTEYTGPAAPPLGDRQSYDSTMSTADIPPGRIPLTVSIRLSLRAVGLGSSGGGPIWEREVTLTTPVSIVAPNASDMK